MYEFKNTNPKMPKKINRWLKSFKKIHPAKQKVKKVTTVNFCSPITKILSHVPKKYSMFKKYFIFVL